MLFMIACNDKSSNKSTEIEQGNPNLTPIEVVEKRMNLFNNHNYNEFISLYYKDVNVYTYPDRLMGIRSDRLSSIFKSDFENKLVTVKVVNQMTNGPYVINHEIVTNDNKETKYISIYKVEKGLITNVNFVRDF